MLTTHHWSVSSLYSVILSCHDRLYQPYIGGSSHLFPLSFLHAGSLYQTTSYIYHLRIAYGMDEICMQLVLYDVKVRSY